MAKFLILGDIHCRWQNLDTLLEEILYNDNSFDAIINVGDFGYGWPGIAENWVNKTGLIFYWAEGNHDNADMLKEHHNSNGGTLPANIVHMPRGSLLNIKGVNLAFFGGASSPDKDQRLIGQSWWPEETIRSSELDSFLARDIGNVDILITHEKAENYEFPPDGPRIIHGGCGASDRIAIQQIVEKTAPTSHFWGHWHYPMKGYYKPTSTEWHCINTIDNGDFVIWENGHIYHRQLGRNG